MLGRRIWKVGGRRSAGWAFGHPPAPAATTTLLGQQLRYSGSIGRGQQSPLIDDLPSWPDLPVLSPVTEQWVGLAREYTSRKEGAIAKPGVGEKGPSESDVSCRLAFSTDPILRANYINPFGGIRVGKLLEDFDILAALAAIKHADDGRSDTAPLTFVTVAATRTHTLHPFDAKDDILLTGRVVWTGSSSLGLMMLASRPPREGEIVPADARDGMLPVLQSCFTFVGIDRSTMRPIPINQIRPTNERERTEEQEGERVVAELKALSARSLDVLPPTEEENQVIHDLFVKYGQGVRPEFTWKKENNLQAGGALPYVLMKETRFSNMSVCMPQKRNANNTIFGGWLMRKGFEIAFSAAKLHSGSTHPRFSSMDSVVFNRPVNIGDVLVLSTEIVFTDEETSSMRVHVTAEIAETCKTTGKTVTHKTNSFVFTFACPGEPIRPVVPRSYSQALRWLEGRRKFLFFQEEDRRAGLSR